VQKGVEGRNQQLGDFVCFGPYEVNRRTGEVRKHGLKIKLSGQCLEVLLLLMEHPGELMSREKLCQRLWSGDVFVNIEGSLNSAVKKLRRALNEDPRQPRYIETHPRKGYRFIGVLEPEVAHPGEPAAKAAHSAKGAIAHSQSRALMFLASRRYWQLAAALAVLLAVGLFMVDGASRRMHTVSAVSQQHRNGSVRPAIAVLGFENLSSDRDDDWLSTAITHMLSTELASRDNVRIIPEETVARAKLDLGLKEKDGYPRDSLRALRADLGSDYVVAGSYVAVGDKHSGKVRVDLRLQETISGEILASIAVTGKQSEIFDLLARAGQEMHLKLGTTVSPGGDVDWRTVLPSNPDAARSYSEGLARLRVFENTDARELLRKSVAIEPNFALGHAALAEAWSALGYDAQAIASAQKAFSLSHPLPEDERLAIEGRYYDLNHDWAGAIGAYRHLWQNFPDDIESGLKLIAAQTSAGRLDEALATLSMLRSDPGSQRDDPRIDLAEASVAAQNADYKRQQSLAEQAAKKAQSSGARLLLARALLVKGWALDDQSKLKEAVEAYSTAQQIFDDTGDRHGTANALNDLGIVLQKEGALAGAREKLEQARDYFRQVGDENRFAAVLTNLGEVYRAQGELTQAEDLYREALSIFHKTGRKDNEHAAMNDLGEFLYQLGDFRGAKKICEDLLEVRTAAGDRNGVALSKANLADALLIEGQVDRAIALYQQSLTILEELGDRATRTAVQVSLARALVARRDFAKARQTLQEALTTNQEIGAKGDAALDRVLLAQVAFEEGHPEQFESSVRASIEELKAEHRGADEAKARAIEAAVLMSQGKLDEASNAVQSAQAIRNIDWLAKFHLALVSAQMEAARGNAVLAKRRLDALDSHARRVGCVFCQSEIRSASAKIQNGRSRVLEGHIVRSAHQNQKHKAAFMLVDE